MDGCQPVFDQLTVSQQPAIRGLASAMYCSSPCISCCACTSISLSISDKQGYNCDLPPPIPPSTTTTPHYALFVAQNVKTQGCKPIVSAKTRKEGLVHVSAHHSSGLALTQLAAMALCPANLLPKTIVPPQNCSPRTLCPKNIVPQERCAPKTLCLNKVVPQAHWSRLLTAALMEESQADSLVVVVYIWFALREGVGARVLSQHQPEAVSSVVSRRQGC